MKHGFFNTWRVLLDRHKQAQTEVSAVVQGEHCLMRRPRVGIHGEKDGVKLRNLPTVMRSQRKTSAIPRADNKARLG